jgi:hypothetical protein
VKGLNTTSWLLTMTYKGEIVLEQPGQIEKGSSHVERSVDLA